MMFCRLCFGRVLGDRALVIVTYSRPEVISGPISLGLAQLPDEGHLGLDIT